MRLENLIGPLHGFPKLPGARCLGKWELFDLKDADDPDREHLEEQAIDACRRCPALKACSDWFSGLDVRDRPSGVVAAQVSRPQRQVVARQGGDT